MTEQSQFGIQPEGQFNPQAEEPEGIRRLRSIGLEELADKETTLQDGRIIIVRDFWNECGEHALPYFLAYDAASSDPLKYALYRKTLRGIVGKYLNMDLSEEQNNES